jgi:hypothetical protein
VKPSGPPCPTCKKPAAPLAENKAFPFCSARCQQVDLGKWLNEEYRMPAEDADDDPEGTPEGTREGSGGEHN